MIQAFFNILSRHDLYTANHCIRVSHYATIIAKSISNDKNLIDRTYASATMHDIGKTIIPESLLNKPERLTKEERVTVQSHALAGYNLLNRFDELSPVAKIVLHHHERYDGHGYPSGLENSHIPLESRIIMIADTFDAITSDRTYHDASSREKALAEISSQASGMFDPTIVEHFIKIAQDTPERLSLTPPRAS